MLAALLIVPAPAAGALPDLVKETVHFDVQGGDLITGVAAFNMSCDANVSGEAITILDNASVRTTVAAAAGPCAVNLILFGAPFAIPTITTTPIGRNSVYLPGVSLGTLGVGDVSLDLQTSLNSTSAVVDPAVASVDPAEVDWLAWGAQRYVVQGAHGPGSTVASAFVTTFVYRVVLQLTISLLGVPVYQTGIRDFGAYVGDPVLTTPVTVDLAPHALALGPARDVTDRGASLNWTGVVDADFDHLELWVTDGTTNVTYRITDRVVSSFAVSLRADTAYHAGMVSVDQGGQTAMSNTIAFHTTATVAPEPTSPTAPTNPPYTETQANLIVIGTFSFIAILSALVAYGFGRARER